jgi:hypothetical protein
MTAGYVGNRHPGLGCLGQDRQLRHVQELKKCPPRFQNPSRTAATLRVETTYDRGWEGSGPGGR